MPCHPLRVLPVRDCLMLDGNEIGSKGKADLEDTGENISTLAIAG